MVSLKCLNCKYFLQYYVFSNNKFYKTADGKCCIYNCSIEKWEKCKHFQLNTN